MFAIYLFAAAVAAPSPTRDIEWLLNIDVWCHTVPYFEVCSFVVCCLLQTGRGIYPIIALFSVLLCD